MKKTLLSISAAALLAAAIDGSQLTSIKKQAVTSFTPVDQECFDLIGKISGEKDSDMLMLMSVNNTDLMFNPEHDKNVAALVLKDRHSGQIILQHTLNDLDENMALQTKQITFEPLQNGAFAVMTQIADSSATINAKIYSDGTMLNLADTEGTSMKFKEPIGSSVSFTVCTENFKPMNTIPASAEQYKAASA